MNGNQLDEPTKHLYNHIGALPSEEFGVMNLMPWAVESDQTNAMKVGVCAAIIDVLREAGFIANPDDTTRNPARAVTLACRSCSAVLTSIAVEDSISNLPASSFITNMARLRPECPHEPVSADDQRRAIQEAVIAAQSQ